jgi:type I restriction enzyme, S subunit
VEMDSTDWLKMSFDEITSEKNQGVNTTVEKVEYSKNGYPVIRAKNVLPYKIDFSELVYVDNQTFNRLSETYKPKINDILYTNIGSQFGNAAVIQENLEFIIAWNVFKIRPNPKIIDSNFFCYLLNLYRNKIRSLNSSSTMPFVNSKEMSKLVFSIPSMPTQQTILKILLSFNIKINKLQQQNLCLEKIIHSIFKSWFIDFDGQIEFVNSELGYIPKGWEVDNIEKLCSKITDGSHQSPKEYEIGTKRIATIKNMREFDIDMSTCKKISDDDYNELVRNGCKPQKGDILFSKDGTMGIIHIFKSDEDIVLLSSIAILTPKNKILTNYLFCYLRNEQTQKILIEGHSSGSVLPRIVLKDFKKFPVLIPSNHLLLKFDKDITPCVDLILKNSKIIERLTKIRDTLLPKLMSGEIQI